MPIHLPNKSGSPLGATSMEVKGGKVLLVDDEIDLLELSSITLSENGYDVTCAQDGIEALKKLERASYDIAIVDLKMPRMDGMELLERIKKKYPETEVIILTGYATIATAVDAMKMGAYGYLVKPFDPGEVLLEMEKILKLQRLYNENRSLREELSKGPSSEEIIGKSKGMLEVYDLIQTVAPTDSTVLIQGESGTGKGLIARAIHRNSLRRDKPFIEVSCVALPESILESELFGHEKGAFTGALSRKLGRFELADGGTLFLDEIGDMSLSIQTKFLRVLQEGEFEPVGGIKTKKVDVRLITATNKNLEQEVANGNFREDLFYRVNVISIDVPPLRARTEDIALLAAYFLEKYRREVKKDVSSITHMALNVLRRYPWPGNVRELENVIERAIVLTKTGRIDTCDLPDNLVREEWPFRSERFSIKEAKDQFERAFLEDALRNHKGNITHTARAIQLARRNLVEKIKKYGLDVEQFKS